MPTSILKIYLLLFLASCIHADVFAQAKKYKRISVSIEKTSVDELQRLGLDLDHQTHIVNGALEFVVSEKELQLLQANHIAYSIVHEDEAQFYADRLKEPTKPIRRTRGAHCEGETSPMYPTPAMFSYGSMGGYLTYSEAIAKLDSLATMYPNILKAKAPISNFTTFEGRNIYWYKISDNPNADEAEPEIFYNALHHAREAVTVSQIAYYMAYLCENYASNPEIKYLVDNTEMYFVPIVNPDGYIYNEINYPFGGGMWRKNRRIMLSGEEGVDLNRNYSLGWGYNNIGSSNLEYSDVYRGPSPASEPETQAMEWFCNTHQFKIALNTHSFSDLLIYPWGYLERPTDDSTLYRTMATQLCKYNYYKWGTDLETVAYATNGSAADFMHDSTVGHDQIYTYIPEAGTVQDGFWPPQSRILPICEEMNYLNLTAAKLLLPYAYTTYEGSRFLNSTASKIEYSINKVGLAATSSFTVSVVPISNNINSVGAAKVYSTLGLAQKSFDQIAIDIKPTTANNSVVTCVLVCDNGITKHYDTLDLVFGNTQTLFVDSCNNLAKWITNDWGAEQGGYNSDSAITESPNAATLSYAYTSIVSKPIYIKNVLRAELQYNIKWALHNNRSTVHVYIYHNGNPIVQCTKYTQPYRDFSGMNSIQEAYTGTSPTWVLDNINLDAFVGDSIQIVFELSADQAVALDGLSIDNVVIRGISNIPASLQHQQSALIVYPNPSTGTIHIKSDAKFKHYRLLDALGSTVASGELQANTINTAGIARGIYQLELLQQETGVRYVERVRFE
jgi:carboxypeptidase T